MRNPSRYIVWRTRDSKPLGLPVRLLLKNFPAVRIVKFEDPDYAVVLMDTGTEEQVKRVLPELSVEKDAQYQMTSGR